MRNQSYSDEAEACRRQAAQFAGRPEARFLLRVARSFEELEAASSVRIDRASSGGSLAYEPASGGMQSVRR
jgi:hypothetical protein